MSYSNLEDYSVEIVNDFTPSFIESVVALYQPYSQQGKEKTENYKPHMVRHMFSSGRFRLGFCYVKFKGNIVLTFGIDDFNGWAVVARYLRHTNNSKFVPFLFGVAIPHLQKHFAKQIRGICVTQNIDQRNIVSAILKRFEKTDQQNNIYSSAADQIRRVRQLPVNVIYRGTEQYAFYIPNENDIPPFHLKQP